MIYSTSIPLIKGAATWGAWRGGEVSLFAGSFGGTVESCCLCLGLWSPLSTCALWGAGALATAPLLFLLVSTKLLLLEDCRTSVIKNKNESCFTYPTPKSTWKSCVHECRGCTHPPTPHYHWYLHLLVGERHSSQSTSHSLYKDTAFAPNLPKPMQEKVHTWEMNLSRPKCQGLI